MKKIDRSNWPSGQWDDEPDRVEWRVGDFYCLVNRVQHSGVFCGYVGVPAGHQWWGQDYVTIDRLIPEKLTVHWGVTFGSQVKGDDYPESHWIVGFDCGHSGDLSPAIQPVLGYGPTRSGDVYRSLRYVVANVRKLLYAAGGSRSPEFLRIVNGEEVRPIHPYRSPVVAGEGAAMLRRWIRFGHSHLAITADWLEDNPEEVEGLPPEDTVTFLSMLRAEVAV